MDFLTVLISLLVGILTSLIAAAVYRITFHPLSRFPGPILWSVTRLPYAYHMFRGRLPYVIAQMHDQYGPIVRLAPSELSFINEEAWNDIYAKLPGQGQLKKDTLQFLLDDHGFSNILVETDDEKHNRIRRNFSLSFGDKNLRAQEPIMKHYIDLLVQKLRQNSGIPINMVKWYNFTTFDLIGDLVFGESFDCLTASNLHFWVVITLQYVIGSAILGMAQRFWPLGVILKAMMPKSLREAQAKHRATTLEKLHRRLDMTDNTRPDFMTQVLKTMNTPSGLCFGDILETSQIILIGGSETTATLLSGVTHYLLTNPSKLQKLIDEVRDAFETDADITMASVSKLDYCLAVLNEGLRMYPPVPGNLRRITSPEGRMIGGVFVPGGVFVAVDLWAAGRSASNFKRAEEFIPERWMGDVEFESDNRKVIQAFSVGPRNCLGKNLAYVEMRLILAHIIFNFDLELVEKDKDWMKDMKVYGFWEKPELMVKLTPVGDQ